MKKLIFILVTLLIGLAPGCQPSPVMHDKFVTPLLDTIDYTYYSTGTGVDTLTSSLRRYRPPTTPPVTPPSDATYNYSFQTSDYSRSGAGVNQFFSGNGQQTTLPFAYQDNDYRFDWVTLQSGASSYNFSALDGQINAMIKVGGKLSFRVVMFDPSRNTCPSFIPMLGGNEPDFNNPTYINAVVAFIKAMSDHLNNTTSVVSGIKLISGVYKMDIPGIGKWGEMHFDGITTGIQTLATAKPIIDATTTYFPNTWLMVVISGLETNSKLGADLANYLLNTSNNLGPVGIRCDHWGWLATFNGFDMKPNAYYSNTALTSILNRWKTSPIAGELMNSLSGINPASPYSDVPAELTQMHGSQFSNSNYCRNSGSGASASQIASSDNNILAASRIAGARIGISSVSTKGNTATITWVNQGNAPVYENWDVYVNGVKSSFNIKSVMPGTFTSTETFSGGLSIIIKDPTGIRKPFNLLNNGRLTDGSYKLF